MLELINRTTHCDNIYYTCSCMLDPSWTYEKQKKTVFNSSAHQAKRKANDNKKSEANLQHRKKRAANERKKNGEASFSYFSRVSFYCRVCENWRTVKNNAWCVFRVVVCFSCLHSQCTHTDYRIHRHLKKTTTTTIYGFLSLFVCMRERMRALVCDIV